MALAAATGVPLIAAAFSPQLEWRDGIYVTASFAGILGLCLLLIQPLLINGDLPGLSSGRGRRVHRWIGVSLVAAVLIHVAGLWVTSPPDMVDALLFRSPTPFSPFGVAAMWAIFATALIATFRRRWRLRPRTWRITHVSLAIVIVLGSVIHGLLIEGTMETMSKAALCSLVVLATVRVVAQRLRTRSPSL